MLRGGVCARPAFGAAPFLFWGVGAAKGLLSCLLAPNGNQRTACTLALWWLKFGPTESGGGVGLGWVKASSGPPGPRISPFPARHNWSGGFTVVRSQGLPD